MGKLLPWIIGGMLGILVGLVAGSAVTYLMLNRAEPASGKSAFYTTCSDLDSLLARSASGATLEQKTPWGGESIHGKHLHHDQGIRCYVVGKPGASDEVLHALKAGVEKLAQQNGAEIIDTVESQLIGKRYGGFTLNYANGRAHGKIEAKVAREDVVFSKQNPDAKGTEIVVTIEEWVNYSSPGRRCAS
jgi:hypothetical protein